MEMEENGGTKVTGIRQNVMLKGLLEKWQEATLGLNCTHTPEYNQACVAISPSINRRLMTSSVYSDSDEEGCQSPEPPLGVPKGYLAVYVGPELRRFIIPTSYLSDPLFKVLLEKVEEEFGFDLRGALTIPCEVETFKYLLQCMENHQKEQTKQNAGSVVNISL